jgi:drug/metabolite transporter (DMT)-like permease
MVIYAILTVSGLILFKLGTNSSQIGVITKGILSLQISFISLAGLVLYACSFFFYLILISKNTLSFFMPFMTGIVYISILTASLFILKEKVTLISLAGSLLILIGVILVVTQVKR